MLLINFTYNDRRISGLRIIARRVTFVYQTVDYLEIVYYLMYGNEYMGQIIHIHTYTSSCICICHCACTIILCRSLSRIVYNSKRWYFADKMMAMSVYSITSLMPQACPFRLYIFIWIEWSGGGASWITPNTIKIIMSHHLVLQFINRISLNIFWLLCWQWSDERVGTVYH